jgi:hypothetical protein
MDFNKWLSGAIKHAELAYIYTESVRGVVDTETRLQRERLQTLKRVREVYYEFSREMEKLIDEVTEARQASNDLYDEMLKVLEELLEDEDYV